MRLVLATATFALLSACGDTANNTAASNLGTSANLSAPEPANLTTSANVLDDARRADMVRECSDDVRNELPQGADLNAFCNCTVDRMQGDSGEREAMEACATQMGIQPRR